MNISSSIKIVPKVFGNKILWYYITMKEEEGDLALEKLEQDPSLNFFCTCDKEGFYIVFDLHTLVNNAYNKEISPLL